MQYNLNGQSQNCVRVFRFLTRSTSRDVSITHKGATWTLYVDGEPVANESHSAWSIFSSKTMQIQFQVAVPGEPAVNGTLTMVWKAGGPNWSYSMVVNTVEVLPCWTKKEGTIKVGIHDVEQPEVIGPSLLALPQWDPPAEPPAWLDDLCMIDCADADVEVGLPVLPRSAPNREDLLALPLVRVLDASDSRCVVCDVRTSEHGTLLTCCESVQQSPNPSRMMIASNPSYENLMLVPPPQQQPLAVTNQSAFGVVR